MSLLSLYSTKLNEHVLLFSTIYMTQYDLPGMWVYPLKTNDAV